MNYKGDLLVGSSLTVGRRFNVGFSDETITAQRDIVKNDYSMLRVSNATTQDVVLPDATTLPNGWEITIDVPSASGASVNVKTYDDTTPELLKNILAGRAYTFILVNNATDAGDWKINFLEEADLIPAERYVETFNATSDWGTASGGYFTMTITAATHGKELQPNVLIQELDGSDYSTVQPDQVKVLANGNIQIRVPEVPDLRFAGRAVIV